MPLPEPPIDWKEFLEQHAPPLPDCRLPRDLERMKAARAERIATIARKLDEQAFLKRDTVWHQGAVHEIFLETELLPVTSLDQLCRIPFEDLVNERGMTWEERSLLEEAVRRVGRELDEPWRAAQVREKLERERREEERRVRGLASHVDGVTRFLEHRGGELSDEQVEQLVRAVGWLRAARAGACVLPLPPRLSERDAAIIAAIAAGESKQAVAARFGLGVARVSQITRHVRPTDAAA